MYAPIETEFSVRTEVLINTLDHVIQRTKLLMFKHHMKDIKPNQTPKDSNIEISDI